MLLSASFVAFLSIISIGSTEEEEETFDYGSLQEVGSIEPIRCDLITAVHIDSDYIYVFCMPQFESARYVRYNIHQKQKPFDLLSLILLFEIEFKFETFGSQLSEVSKCLYIHNSGSEYWKIRVGDQVVTRNHLFSMIRSLAISSNGQLFFLLENTQSSIFHIEIYASDDTPLGMIVFPYYNMVLPSIVHADGNTILIAHYKYDNLAPDLCNTPRGINKLEDGVEEERVIWKFEKHREDNPIIGRPRTMSDVTESGSSFSFIAWEWVEVTKNNEGMPTYYDHYSNTIKSLPNDDLWSELEMSDDLLSSYFDIIRNMVSAFKERFEVLLDLMHQFGNCFLTGHRVEIILMYKCLNQTYWCETTLGKVEGMDMLHCLTYERLRKSNGNWLIKPPNNYDQFPKKVMIYTVK